MLIELQNLKILKGYLSPRALGLVMEWAAMHQNELLHAWEQALNHQIPDKIEPLK
ncbi:MAG: DUF4160 domain-containing protein [Nitrospirae bacterium]|nr:DUF4160 domain-containing protein [Nitrospirota bacterium]